MVSCLRLVFQEKEEIIQAWQQDHDHMRAIAENAEAHAVSGAP